MLEKGCWWTHPTKDFLQKHKNDHKLTQFISDFVNFWPQLSQKHNQTMKIATKESPEIMEWWKNNQLGPFIMEEND